MKENVLQAVDEMFNALMQFKSCRVTNVRDIFSEACGITPELFLKADPGKLPVIIWGIFQFWYGYTRSSVRGEYIK